MFLRKAVVLGDGQVARAMAEDLSRSRQMSVTVAAAAALADSQSVASLVGDFAVVLNALPPDRALGALAATIESNRLIADAGTAGSDARALDQRAVEMEVAACVGCGREGLAALLGRSDLEISDEHRDLASLDARIAAWMATAWARRLLTGDFRGHWGVWTPERLGARVGMRNAILEDLGGRGIHVT
jgi:saccharopine dehydrogenase-like NADP-dependent oxidoreductase